MGEPKVSDFNSELEKMIGFKTDPWLGIAESFFKDHLVALGMISIDWNASESLLRLVVAHYLELPEKYSPMIMRQLGNIAIVDLLLECSTIKETDQRFLAAISHLCKFYNRCRENRNDIMHSLATFNFKTFDMEKPPSQKSKTAKVFRFELKDLRRVADDIKNLNAGIASLMFAIKGDQQDHVDAFLQIDKLPLPDKLIPLPPEAPKNAGPQPQ
jgi:hypothetical protein